MCVVMLKAITMLYPMSYSSITKSMWQDLGQYNEKSHKCLQLLYFLLISHINKAYQDLFIIRKEKLDLASIGCMGRSPCKRGLTNCASRGQGSIVLQNFVSSKEEKIYRLEYKFHCIYPLTHIIKSVFTFIINTYFSCS